MLSDTGRLSCCPFCGEEAELKGQLMKHGEGACEHVEDSTFPISWVECNKCFSTGPVMMSVEGATEGWNQRALGVM